MNISTDPLALVSPVATITTLFLAGTMLLIMTSIRRRIGTSILSGGFRKTLVGILSITAALFLYALTVLFPTQTAVYALFFVLSIYFFVVIGLLHIVIGYKQLVDKLESLSH